MSLCDVEQSWADTDSDKLFFSTSDTDLDNEKVKTSDADSDMWSHPIVFEQAFCYLQTPYFLFFAAHFPSVRTSSR